MRNVRDWFNKHKVQIGMHINEKRPSSTPLYVWWIYLLAAAEFSCLDTTAFMCPTYTLTLTSRLKYTQKRQLADMTAAILEVLT